MKKHVSILFSLLLILTLSLTACGGQEQAGTDDSSVSVESAQALLTTVWDSYGEEEKFPVAGGDTSEEHITEDAPGQFSLDDPAVVDNMLGFPAPSVSDIDDAASMIHMMNANTFTCGAYHAVDPANTAALANAVEENILQRQWMCGFPDKVVIAVIGDYIVSYFGHTDLVDTFTAKLTEAYPSAEIVCDKPVM